MKPLRVERWDQVVCKEASVGLDWRVQFEKAFYTVPYRLIGERVLVLGNSQVVRVFLDYEEVTAHPRCCPPAEISGLFTNSPEGEG